MNLDPLLPLWVLVALAAILLGYCGWAWLHAPATARRMWPGRMLMVVALFAALARPGIGSVAANVATDSLDVLFVVDTSASVAAEDWQSSQQRLDGMKADITALAEAHPGARFALITFGSTAVQRLPFTNDATALREAVALLHPEGADVAHGSSATVAAELTTDVLDAAAQADVEGDRARLVYYLGDGESTRDDAPEDFTPAGLLVQGGAVFGYGTTEGAPMRQYFEYERAYRDYYYDALTGKVGISRLDEAALQAIGSELRVPVEIRNPGEPVTPAQVDSHRGNLSAEARSRMSFPVYWVFAGVVAAWLLVEAFVVARTLRLLRDTEDAGDGSAPQDVNSARPRRTGEVRYGR